MNRLPGLRGRVRAALAKNADLLYPRTLTFKSGVHSWQVRCSVRDPDPRDTQAFERATRLVPPDLTLSDMRLVEIHPEDTEPVPGARTDRGAFDGGTLELLEYGQESALSGLSLGVAVLRR